MVSKKSQRSNPYFLQRENSFLSRTSQVGGTSIARVVIRVSAQWKQSSGARTGVSDYILMIF